MSLHPVVAEVTERIRERSAERRAAYLERVAAARARGPRRPHLACSNLAHAYAAAPAEDKGGLRSGRAPNVAIVTAYNDMLSAHQPFASFPAEIKLAVRAAGGVAQVAGGVPAMCDGVTQGEAGMELSLLSRDVIALATAVALSHDVFEAGLCLGVCDKIVPGLLIGALAFGHLPFVFVPAGPMPSGLPNGEKQRIRQLHAEGRVGREELLAAEEGSYHGPGTCTFFGTANSNQMFLELMGLHLPGASFENPGTPLRRAFTAAAGRRAVALAREGEAPLGRVVDERAVVNGVVGLLATGGSTNHTLHLVAIARAAGLVLDWDDFADLSRVVPLLARVYPNGRGDVNDFHRAGGMAFLVAELLRGGLVHGDIASVAPGGGLAPYARPAALHDGELAWGDAPRASGDAGVLRPLEDAFSPDGGLRIVRGPLGRGVIKTSALPPGAEAPLTAPAAVFADPAAVEDAFRRGDLDRDVVVVLPFQGPRANGMPELHKLTPPLGALQDRGHRVALVTDGRLSGASGKVPAVLHVTPEAAADGPLGRIRDGDRVLLDPRAGRLDLLVAEGELAGRSPRPAPSAAWGCGRGLFAGLRAGITPADAGASSLGDLSA